jgi:Protein of unknown function (DUF2505)
MPASARISSRPRTRVTVRVVDFHVEYPYATTADALFAMFSQPEFVLAKLEATGATDCAVVECEATADGGFRIVTKRTVEADIPGFAKRVFKPTNALTQIEDWQPASAGSRTAIWRIETKGVPVSTSGVSRIEPTGTGSVQHIEGKIKVSVPLIGGRLERFVYDQAHDTLNIEHEFGQHWLTQPTGEP